MIGPTISPYRIIQKLGGRRDVVYKAKDTRPHRFVALMKGLMRSFANSQALAVAATLLPAALLATDVDNKFHNAPASAQAAKNPYAGQEAAAQEGRKLEVVRFPYHNGDLKASGSPQHIADLPTNWFGHTTRAVEFSGDGRKCSSR